jgi:hypothetical protein
VALLRDGSVLYRLEFVGRPELNSDSFDSIRPYDLGDTFNALELADNWIVLDVLHAPDGEPDTLRLTIQEAV